MCLYNSIKIIYHEFRCFFLLAKPHRFCPAILFGTEWITARDSFIVSQRDQRGAKDDGI